MFLFWTIISMWVLLVFDQVLLMQPIEPLSIQSFLLFVPTSILGWVLIVSWMIPLLLVIFFAVYFNGISRAASKMITPASLGAVGNMKLFDWALIVLTIVLACIGWVFGTTALLLLSTIAAIGLSLNKFEQWYVG